jgi:hypothetical protein
MFPIPDGRCTARCFRGGEMTGLALGTRHFQKPPDRLQFEPRNTSDVDCQMRNLNLPTPPRRTLCRDTEKLAPPAAVSPPATF